MLTEAQWAAIKDAVNRVCNRESDREVIAPGNHNWPEDCVVVRNEDHCISLFISPSDEWNLEPADA